jgi:predicted nucleotide-binding protein
MLCEKGVGWSTARITIHMNLGDQGIVFLPHGCGLPEGSYPVYSRIEVADDGSATGEVHFLSEPKHPRPIAIGKDFDLHIRHPDSILGESVILNVKFVDNAGSVAGFVRGSSAQFRNGQVDVRSKTGDPLMSSRDVFVIHGRDERLRSGIFEFLRSLGLNPMEWAHAVELTGKGAPYVGEILDAAFSHAQAVVVLFSPDDLAELRPELRGPKEPEYETTLTPQARPNVLFEAGMAMAHNPERTIMVEIGDLRPFSDVGGRHIVRMDNTAKKRNELATRLKTAGCPVNLAGTDWQTTGDLRAPEPNTRTRSVRDNVPGLSAEAQQLLFASSEDPAGTVMCIPTIQGLTVSTNNKGFAESGNPRSQAKWKAAIAELVKAGLLEPLSEEAFGITNAGYETAERMRAEQGTKPIAKPTRDFSISLSVDGTPPSQTIKVSASVAVRIVRLEYMLSNETCVAAQDVSIEGETAQIPLNHDLIRKIWNVARSDRNHSDHSGPAKIGVTISAGGKARQHVLPVQMESVFINSTAFARLVGSKTFYET